MDTPFVIESGIPVPPPSTVGRPGPLQGLSAVVKQMAVGDSVLIPATLYPAPRLQKGCSGLVATIGKRYARTFTTRKSDDGVRIWRVA